MFHPLHVIEKCFDVYVVHYRKYQAAHPCSACTKLFVIALSAYNKAYPRRSEYLPWPAAHCGKRQPQRRVSKTLSEIFSPNFLCLKNFPMTLINKTQILKIINIYQINLLTMYLYFDTYSI